jgi:hypothetical protein
MNVEELIQYLKENFDGNKKVWLQVSDDPENCYTELRKGHFQLVDIEYYREEDSDTMEDQLIIGSGDF